MATHYKIRRKTDGLFSTGGGDPNFTTGGKTYTTMGAVQNHISTISKRTRRVPPHSYQGQREPSFEIYEDCELVEFELVETATQDVMPLILGKKQVRDQKEQEYREKQEQREKLKRQQLYTQLNKEFGDV